MYPQIRQNDNIQKRMERVDALYILFRLHSHLILGKGTCESVKKNKILTSQVYIILAEQTQYNQICVLGCGCIPSILWHVSAKSTRLFSVASIYNATMGKFHSLLRKLPKGVNRHQAVFRMLLSYSPFKSNDIYRLFNTMK